jgi:hypothetical protein
VTRSDQWWASGLSLALTLLLGAACNEPTRGQLHTCSCSYLTDTDLASSKTAVVCAEDGARAVGEARRCVTGEGVGTVEACSCDAAREPCSSVGCIQ